MVKSHILLLALVLGHMAVDINQGALPALLPFFKDTFELSYTQSAAILMTMTFSSSIIQPLFGYFSDRFSTHWMLPAGVFVGGAGFALLGFIESYWQLLLVVFISGLGVAAYHPQGAKSALDASPKKVVSMSWFMVGGNAGFGLGPLAMAACFALAGQKGLLLFALPAIVVSFALVRLLKQRKANGQVLAPRAQLAPQPIGKRLKPMALLLTSVIFRSSVQTGFLVFMPFYLINYLGWSKLDVAPLLTFYLIVGSVGTVIGGHIGQRIGPRRFFIISVLLVAPLNLLFLQVESVFMVYGVLVLSAGTLMSTWSSMVVMAQEIMPDRSGMAAALMVGFSIGGGGMCATLMGLMADKFEVISVMWLMVFLPLISALLVALVPQGQTKAGAVI